MSDEKKKIMTKTMDKTLKCVLNNDEKLDVANHLADAHQKLADTQDEFDALKADFKGRIGAEEANISRCSSILRAGYVHRSVKCDVKMDYKLGTVIVIRKDTGAIVEDRVMSEQEKQMELDVE